MEEDRKLAITRVIKYLIEGIAVALVALMWLPAREAIVVAASAAANSATAEPPANLLARPGFEAAEAALKTSWHPFEPGGYEVDRQEKHTGNQSIKLAPNGFFPLARKEWGFMVL